MKSHRKKNYSYLNSKLDMNGSTAHIDDYYQTILQAPAPGIFDMPPVKSFATAKKKQSASSSNALLSTSSQSGRKEKSLIGW